MLNKVILIGNVGNEPTIKALDGGVKTANLRLATSKRFKGADGEMKEVTQWHNVEMWRNLADVVDKYVRKGDKLYIEGELNYRTYTDKEGIERMVTSIVASDLKMLSPKAQNAQQAVAPAPVVEPPQPAYEGLPF